MSEDYKIIEGYVDKIRFRNDVNGYTVLSLETQFGDWTCVGIFPFISEGQYLELTGKEFDNEKYSETQFQVVSYEEKQPEDMMGMERYLSSGAIKGVGPNLAKRIMKKFKLDAFRIIEEEPERLAEIKGISERMAMSIASQFAEMREMREAMVYLAKYNIPNHYAVKIYTEYGEELYNIIKENPYKLAEDISGIGFRTADEIARKVGIDLESEFRVCAGLTYIMNRAGGLGHVYLPIELLLERVSVELGTEIDRSLLEKCLEQLIVDGKLIRKQFGDEQRIYSPLLYKYENNTAYRLLELKYAYDMEDKDVIITSESELTLTGEAEEKMKYIEKSMQVVLDDLQRQAVWEALHHGVTIITGGPGTGKTTIINAIIRYLESEGMEILLAAPTGRAAKRMKEATGCEAKTIHRLLEISGNPESDAHFKFEKNSENPLEADAVIIDEASMVDISLMHSLLEAVIPGTRLVLVGDVNQLPSVGPGNVLKDLIMSNAFTTVCLNRIYRQEEGSRIVLNAHKINAGQPIPVDNKSSDFFFMPRGNAKDVVDTTIALVKEKMPGYVKVMPEEVQVLAPMKKGDVGVVNLNRVLQNAVNPPSSNKQEWESGNLIYREGDKVMQVKNNYKLEWVVETDQGMEIEQGTGVFNGDMGVITNINTFAEEITVEFDEGHKVIYPFGFLDELDLAYAVTIHKSQGSEYPVVVLPVLDGPPVLFTRNLLYTAVTRARACVVIVGNMQMISRMIANNNEHKRYSGLKEAVHELRETVYHKGEGDIPF